MKMAMEDGNGNAKRNNPRKDAPRDAPLSALGLSLLIFEDILPPLPKIKDRN
jgi:hypothetical protein